MHWYFNGDSLSLSLSFTNTHLKANKIESGQEKKLITLNIHFKKELKRIQHTGYFQN